MSLPFTNGGKIPMLFVAFVLTCLIIEVMVLKAVMWG